MLLQAWRASSQLLHRNTASTPGEDAGSGYCLTIVYAQSDLNSGTLNVKGCILWHNYWPLLTGAGLLHLILVPQHLPTLAVPLTEHVLYAAFMYVLVPMPWLFFGQADSGSSSIYGGSSLASGWIDAGKFLTGFSAVGSIAIPAILYHAQVRSWLCLRCMQLVVPFETRASQVINLPMLQKIEAGALGFELAAVAVLGGTVLAYDYFTSRDSSYGY